MVLLFPLHSISARSSEFLSREGSIDTAPYPEGREKKLELLGSNPARLLGEQALHPLSHGLSVDSSVMASDVLVHVFQVWWRSRKNLTTSARRKVPVIQCLSPQATTLMGYPTGSRVPSQGKSMFRWLQVPILSVIHLISAYSEKLKPNPRL